MTTPPVVRAAAAAVPITLAPPRRTGRRALRRRLRRRVWVLERARRVRVADASLTISSNLCRWGSGSPTPVGAATALAAVATATSTVTSTAAVVSVAASTAAAVAVAVSAAVEVEVAGMVTVAASAAAAIAVAVAVPISVAWSRAISVALEIMTVTRRWPILVLVVSGAERRLLLLLPPLGQRLFWVVVIDVVWWRLRPLIDEPCVPTRIVRSPPKHTPGSGRFVNHFDSIYSKFIADAIRRGEVSKAFRGVPLRKPRVHFVHVARRVEIAGAFKVMADVHGLLARAPVSKRAALRIEAAVLVVGIRIAITARVADVRIAGSVPIIVVDGVSVRVCNVLLALSSKITVAQLFSVMRLVVSGSVVTVVVEMRGANIRSVRPVHVEEALAHCHTVELVNHRGRASQLDKPTRTPRPRHGILSQTRAAQEQTAQTSSVHGQRPRASQRDRAMAHNTQHALAKRDAEPFVALLDGSRQLAELERLDNQTGRRQRGTRARTQ